MLGFHCCARAFSSGGEQGLLFVAVRGLLIVLASLCGGARALGVWASVVVARGLSSCGSRALWRTGLVAPWHVGSSWTRDRTCVPCIDRRILNHCATREVPTPIFKTLSLEPEASSSNYPCLFLSLPDPLQE